MKIDIRYLSDDEILSLENGKKYKLNDTGKIFIDELQKKDYNEAIVSLSNRYNIDCEMIKSDLINLYNKLIESGDEPIGSLPFRHHMVLEPTNDCDAHCVHCFHRYRKKHSWDKQKIDQYINILLNNNIRSVSITGGEIFSPHYEKYAKYLIEELKKNNIKICTISTNGMFLTADLIQWIVNVINIKETVFRISVDSIEEINVFKIRPGYKKYYNKSYWKLLNDNGIKVIVTTIISKQDRNELIKICDYLVTQKSVVKWIIKPLIPTKESHYKYIDWNQIITRYREFLDWYKENQLKVNFDFVLGNVISKKMLILDKSINYYNEKEHPCKNEMFQKTIKANGNLTRCPIIPELSDEYQICLIDIKKTSKQLFDNITIKDLKCNSCEYKKVCGGGCRAYAIAFTKDEKGCDINSRIMYEWILKSDYFKLNWNNFYSRIIKCIDS